MNSSAQQNSDNLFNTLGEILNPLKAKRELCEIRGLTPQEWELAHQEDRDRWEAEQVEKGEKGEYTNT